MFILEDHLYECEKCYNMVCEKCLSECSWCGKKVCNHCYYLKEELCDECYNYYNDEYNNSNPTVKYVDSFLEKPEKAVKFDYDNIPDFLCWRDKIKL
jgi:hypothetical protein